MSSGLNEVVVKETAKEEQKEEPPTVAKEKEAVDDDLRKVSLDDGFKVVRAEKTE